MGRSPPVVVLALLIGVTGLSPGARVDAAERGAGIVPRAPAATPAPDGNVGMAYDAARGNIVLFTTAGQTWTWDGSSWDLEAPAAVPPTRYGPAMAYDAARREVVLFGGCCDANDAEFDDTWTWNGTTWTQRFPTHSPDRRNDAMAAFDAARENTVLYGGISFLGDSPTTLDDTWTWDGVDWTPRATGDPASRHDAAMAYDAARKEVVLFGGQHEDSGFTFLYRDTWSWDGTAWALQSASRRPSARYGARMAFDPVHEGGVDLLFGGNSTPSGVDGDNWTWDGTNWTMRHPLLSPSARYDMGMAYDAIRRQTVLFGGFDGGTFGDTWAAYGPRWHQVA
jgi:hypothetical protein